MRTWGEGWIRAGWLERKNKKKRFVVLGETQEKEWEERENRDGILRERINRLMV